MREGEFRRKSDSGPWSVVSRFGWLVGLIVVAAGVMLGCASREGSPVSRYEFERPQMGLPFRLVLYAPDAVTATNAAEAVWTRIAELNSILSDYETNSELSQLSRSSDDGEWVALGPDLSRVLVMAEKVSRRSGGAFDVTVGPQVQLWRRARRQRELPSAAALARAQAVTGWTNLVLRRESAGWAARLVRPGMRLDLGGIAKGYALDEAARVLRDRGLSQFLVSGGGDLVVGEPPPGTAGWKIEVGHFDSPQALPPRWVWLRNTALATSGDAFQRAEIGGIRYSHIVDPKTGIGLMDHRLVTVIAREGMVADALSTATSVLPPQDALQLVREFGAEMLMLRQPTDRIEEVASPRFWRWASSD